MTTHVALCPSPSRPGLMCKARSHERGHSAKPCRCARQRAVCSAFVTRTADDHGLAVVGVLPLRPGLDVLEVAAQVPTGRD